MPGGVACLGHGWQGGRAERSGESHLEIWLAFWAWKDSDLFILRGFEWRLLLEILGGVSDPRTGNAQRHRLLDRLVIALVASVCGAESWLDFAEFAADRELLLRDFPSLENGLPSHDTFSRRFRLPDPTAFGRVFEAVLEDLGAEGFALKGNPPASGP